MHDIATIRKIKRLAESGMPVPEITRKMRPKISIHTVRYHANEEYRKRLNALHMRKYYEKKLLEKEISSGV